MRISDWSSDVCSSDLGGKRRMTMMIIAALIWVLLHVVVAGPLRPALVGRLGLPAYRGLFSLLSAVCLAGLIWAYRAAPYVEFWPSAGWVRSEEHTSELQSLMRHSYAGF